MSEWYSLPQIRFTSEQIIWIIGSGGLLHAGQWPPEPKTSGYTDMPAIKKGGKKNAKFTKAVEVIAEVERRLEHCGLDGLLTYLHYGFDWDEITLSKYYRIPDYRVTYRIEVVIWYISGWNFYKEYWYKQLNASIAYENWKAQNETLLSR